MKRKISLLLSLIMVLSTLAIDTSFAATSSYIKLNYLVGKRLVETKEGITVQDVEKDVEEATLEWDISYNGHYELVYYTDSIKDNLNDTSKVTVSFDVGKNSKDEDEAGKVKVQAQIEKSEKKIDSSNGAIVDDGLLDLTHYQYFLPYTGAPTITKGKVFNSDLSFSINGEAVAKSANELSVKLGSNLCLRMRIDGTTIKVWTNEIKKGYFTDFALSYGEKGGKNPETSTVMVFPGVSNTNISSTHLEETSELVNNSLMSKDKINAPDEIAGQKPGIKVEMERPKIRNGSKFEYIQGEVGESLKVTLNLETKLEENDTLSSNQVQVNFDLSGDMTKSSSDKPITGNIVTGSDKNAVKYVSFEQEKLCLYFSKEQNYVAQKYQNRVIEWPALEESMVIGGELTLTGKLKVDEENYEFSTGNIALNTGYTFLQYTPEQTNVGETTLQITPFKYKGEVIYQVYSISGDQTIINEDKSLFGTYKFTYDPAYPTRKLEISIPSAVPTTFMIKAILSSENNNATSQKVYYNSDDASIVVKPYTPQIREINNIYVIPEKKANSNVEAAGFTITWTAPEEQKLKATIGEKGKLYFELALYNSSKDNKAAIAVFEATLKGGKVQIRALDSKYEGLVTYDSEKAQFTATQVVLKDMQEVSWRKIKFKDKYEDEMKYPYTEITPSDYAAEFSYTIPNSFYLTMRTVLDSGVDNAKLSTSSNESSDYPLTLDKTVEFVPTPSVFEKKVSQDKPNVTVSFNNISLSNYRDYVLKPGKWILNGSDHNETLPGTYEITLYQDTYIDEAGKKQTNDINESKMTSYLDSINYEKLDEYNASSNNKIYVIKEALTKDSKVLDLESDSKLIDALRSGKVIKFDYNEKDMNGESMIPVQIEGLDPNQSYYIRVRVKLEMERTKNGELESADDCSMFSKVFGFTTSTVSKPVGPDEQIPATPKQFEAEAKDNSTAILNWKDPDVSVTEETTIRYEIIRTKEKKLNEELLKSRDIHASEIISKEQAKGATLLNNYKVISINGQVYYELVDDTLQPNTLYYYYVRTVYNGIYSEWVYQPITTKNIDKPISLKAYNAQKTTVDISFLAKAPYHLIPDTYDFGIMIQSEESPDWENVSKSQLKRLDTSSQVTTEDGYNYYEYRISGLKPGKRYNIRVCVIDKSKEQIDGQYQQSLYSDIAYIRTEYDEESQLKEDKYEEFLKKFDSEAEKLRRKPYWVVEEGTTYKYRAGYINSDMALSKTYELISDKESDEATYYLPISVITKMNEQQVTFKINLGNEEINVRPHTIAEDEKQIKEAISEVAANRLEDYYVKISVLVSTHSTYISGEKAISPQIIIDAEVVYMRQEDMLTETDILEALEELIQSERKSFISKLETKVTGGTLDDEILQGLISTAVNNIETKHTKKVDKIMDSKIKKAYSISSLSKSILIIHKTSETLTNAYYYESGWIKKQSFIVSGGVAVEATLLGKYIFTGQNSLIQTLPSLAPYQNMIDQYGLDEFFILNSYMISTAATKEQTYGALARVMGAASGTDYTAYLTSKGIKGLSKIGLKTSIRQDETIYILMQGYEILKRRNINAVVIKNKQSVQNIGAFQPAYRQYVYAAVELKIIAPNNAKVLPSKEMTAQEIIQILYKIQS